MTPEKAFAAIISDLKEQIRAEVMNELRAELNISPGHDMSFSEAMKYLDVSETTLRRWCKEKKIPHRVVGYEGSKKPRYVFNSASLDWWKREEEFKNYSPDGVKTG